MDYFATCTCKETGRRYVMEGKRKFGQMYYSADGFKTQARLRTLAKDAAVKAGTIYWLPDKPAGALPKC